MIETYKALRSDLSKDLTCFIDDLKKLTPNDIKCYHLSNQQFLDIKNISERLAKDFKYIPKGSSNMNVIPTNLNDLKEDIRHASPSRLQSYQILQLEAYTAFISVYDGVKGSTEDKINAANKIINDLFLLEMDQLGYYFDRECAETAKTGLEFALNEKYNGKFAKKVENYCRPSCY